MNWIVAYDVADDRRRDQVSTLLSRRGWRIQFSVFEVELSSGEFAELVDDITACMDELADRVHLFPACKCSAKRVMLGQATLPSEERFYVV